MHNFISAKYKQYFLKQNERNKEKTQEQFKHGTIHNETHMHRCIDVFRMVHPSLRQHYPVDSLCLTQVSPTQATQVTRSPTIITRGPSRPQQQQPASKHACNLASKRASEIFRQARIKFSNRAASKQAIKHASKQVCKHTVRSKKASTQAS